MLLPGATERVASPFTRRGVWCAVREHFGADGFDVPSRYFYRRDAVGDELLPIDCARLVERGC